MTPRKIQLTRALALALLASGATACAGGVRGREDVQYVEEPASQLYNRGADALDHAAALARAREVMAEVELAEKCDSLPGTLSGGQKQRVAIARALFNKPKLMICDEPTGNLDTATAQAILDLFRKLNEDQGITLVIVTHDDMISQACKRVVRIADGKIVDGGEISPRRAGHLVGKSTAVAPELTP